MYVKEEVERQNTVILVAVVVVVVLYRKMIE